MLESLRPRVGKRWPRGQKFILSTTGVEAEAAYRLAVQASRTSGRSALANAERTWAEPLSVQASDGVVLTELRAGRKSLADLSRGLETCGTTPAEVKASVDRLAEAGLVEPTATGAEVTG